MAFTLSLLAGLSTLIGTLYVILIKKENDNTIISALAFSASIVFFVSIIDLIPEGINFIKNNNTKEMTMILAFIFILVGILISYSLDKILPEENNKLHKISILSIITIILHNIPEGIATYITAKTNTNLGVSLAIAIALHNIPEGIIISLPVYYSTKSKRKAFLYTMIAALSEPLGALLAFLFLQRIITVEKLGYIYFIIAGIMIYLSIFELLKASISYKKKKVTILSLFIGFLIFMIGFILF